MKYRFLKEIINYLGNNWNNDFKDNFDFGRFGQPERDIVNGGHALLEIEKYIDGLDKFYNLLEDESSRYLFIQVLSFRILGHRKIRLHLSTEAYWKAITKLNELVDKGNYLEAIFPVSGNIKLHYMDLCPLDIPVKLFTTPRTVLTQFLIKQYERKIPGKNLSIEVKPGDIVIDGGACWGDATLYFADKVGRDGMVYAFEFIPTSLNILKKNLSLNHNISRRIKVVERPLWNVSRTEMYYKDKGPGSKVALQSFANTEGTVSSISIDDFVKEENLNKVDFIKMDIEGSEQKAIKGAINTLERFRPQLAISIYHNFGYDFANIANILNDLNLGYKFYLGHFTIHHEETVLFAVPGGKYV